MNDHHKDWGLWDRRLKSKWRSAYMKKHLATMTLILSLGVANVYAQQTHVNMTVSGTAAPSTVNLQVG